MKTEIFVLRCYGPAIHKTQSNMEKKKNKMDRKSFIFLLFKSFQGSRLGDVRKQQQSCSFIL